MRPRLTYANVMATIAVFIALGGASYAALKLPKNSVGAKQLKKSAVVTAKIKNEAITAAKVKKGTLTGTQINVSTLGTVPAAVTAQSAENIPAPEAYHEVTEFLNGWSNLKLAVGGFPETVAYYKDLGGVVHLRGEAISGTPGSVIFKLPPGYRPSSGRFIREPVTCLGPGCPGGIGSLTVAGPNFPLSAEENGVVAPLEADDVFLDGVTFRAGS
jgi:hypothetical protein